MMHSKVSIVRCADYDQKNVYPALKRAVDLIGGFSSFARGNKKVFLKPNLLSARPPEDGVDTHPEFIRAVIRLVREAGCKVILGDSPGGTIRDPELVYEKSGVKKLADEEGVELVKFERAVDIDGIAIASVVKECDCVINLPKAKTHNLTILTGAVKNILGTVPGMTKAMYHLEAPNARDFSRLLVDIFERVKPELSIMDGIYAMEGEGPAAGPLQEMGLIIASSDAVALDAVFSAIVGLDSFKVWTTRMAHERGLGAGRLNEIDIVGERLEEVRVENFKLPQSSLLTMIPSGLLKPLGRLVKFYPVIDADKCNRCKLCEQSCPAGAIAISKEEIRVHLARCITCMCCMEVCPSGAISIRKSRLAALFTRDWVIK